MTFKVQGQNMLNLTKEVIKLAHEKPSLRKHLIPILRKYAQEEESPAKGTGKGVGGKFLEFLKAVGEKRVSNPDTGNKVKVKSLKGPKGKKLRDRMFQTWLKREETKGERLKRRRVQDWRRRQKKKKEKESE